MAEKASTLSTEEVFFRVLEEISLPTRSLPIYKTLDSSPMLLRDVEDLMERRNVQYPTDVYWNGLVNEYFSHPFLQLLLVACWNHMRGWGFTWEDFYQALHTIPSWPEEHLVAVTLVPYLGKQLTTTGQISDTQCTYRELWRAAKSQYRKSFLYPGHGKLVIAEQLRYLDGLERKSALCWEIISLGCQCMKSPAEVRHSDKSPHAGILASAVLHPGWIRSMERKTPYVWLPGYHYQYADTMPRVWMPTLKYFHEFGIWLDYAESNGYSDNQAVPTFFQADSST